LGLVFQEFYEDITNQALNRSILSPLSGLTFLKNIFLLIVGLLCYQQIEAQTFVNKDATGRNDGSSWEHAFANLHDALSAASENEQIWVATGTYLPGKAGDPKSTVFHITTSIQLYGGFAGTEASLSERMLDDHPTILSGDLKQDDIENDFQTNRTDNVQTILLVQNTSTAVPLIDGFIIEGGHADGELELISTARGGGIYSYGPIDLRNCEFRQNYAKEDGAGLLVLDSLVNVSSPIQQDSVAPGSGMTIDHCTFAHNYAGDEGAGIQFRIMQKRPFQIVVTHSTFSYNKAMSGGGAITNLIATASYRQKITHCTFDHNEAITGGAIINILQAPFAAIDISACHFSSNKNLDNSPQERSRGGGAIRFHFRLTSKRCVGNISGCTFTENETALYGGGLFFTSTNKTQDNKVIVDNCRFNNNKADGGGAIALMSRGLKDSLGF